MIFLYRRGRRSSILRRIAGMDTFPLVMAATKAAAASGAVGADAARSMTVSSLLVRRGSVSTPMCSMARDRCTTTPGWMRALLSDVGRVRTCRIVGGWLMAEHGRGTVR
ncbi:unannotated protein [freshwater metagenome]|uniref:Unannotated protein n=1 Tax=freshwater metagenome TaxID=449393 RepID=A0A6J7FAP6_9ZZZZ